MRGKRKDVKDYEPRFIPTTREVSIGDGVVYRPIRQWHSGTYAGEGLTSVGGDGSGCLHIDGDDEWTSPAKSVVARLYWNTKNPDDTVSAFLSYPNGMGCLDEYFWEALGTRPDGDIERWTGPDAEADMETEILAVLGDSRLTTAHATEVRKSRDERPQRMEEAKRSMKENLKILQAANREVSRDDGDPFDLN